MKTRAGAVVAVVAVTGLMWAAPARADGAGLQLQLDEHSRFVKVADAAASLRDCADVPGGAAKGTDGWVFDQPIHDAVNPATAIGFVDATTGADKPVILRVDGDGVWLVPISGGHAGTLQPAPAGVAGGQLGGGSSGSWLRTPAGWTVVAGSDNAESGTTTATTFALVGVCAPVPAATPSPGTSGGGAGTVAPTSTADRSAAPTAPNLPVTGDRSAVIAGAGALLVLVGATVVALAVRRRRERVRFVA